MFYKCECGTTVHLNTKLRQDEQIVNLLCIECFKRKKPNVYLVEYDIFPLRAIYRTKVFANSEQSAIEVVRIYKENSTIRTRKVKLIEEY